MEASEVSIHQLKVYDAVRRKGSWITAREIAGSLDGVADRTVRAHAFKLAELGIFEVAEVFPANHYRVSEHAEMRNPDYLQRLEHAREVFAASDE